MAKAFSIRDFMQDTRQQDSDSDVYEKVSVYDIGLNPKNEYTMSEIEKIKDSIYALGGVQQNVVLVRCPEGADHKYLALDGHRRLTASRELVAEGYDEFEFVPAVIKGQIDNDLEDAMLVMMNSTQRNKTDWERVMEHMRLKEIIPKIKKRQGIDGRARDIEADMLGVSRGQISIYNTIGTKLNAELMKLFENGRIGISLAHEAAKLEPGLQEQLVEMAHDNGSICDEDIKRLVDRNPINGQLKISGISGENVPESGTSDRSVSGPVPDLETKENVPESGTSKVPQMASENREKINKNLAEGDKIGLAQDKDEISAALEFIFQLDEFPEDKLDELKNAFLSRPDFTVGSLAAEIIFKKILPYENKCVKVIYYAGYQVHYIHTEESVRISIYDFWKGFTELYGITWNEGDAAMMAREDISEKPVENKGERQDVKIRGGYEPILIEDLIEEYKSYLRMSMDENRDKQICKYNCLLDALELLREKHVQGKE